MNCSYRPFPILLMTALAVMSLAVSTAQAALITQGTMIMHITVNQIFRLDLGTFRGGTGPTSFDFVPLASNAITFPAKDPGQFTGFLPSVLAQSTSSGPQFDSGLIMKVGTNNGQIWRLQVNDSQALTRGGSAETIPNTNFKYITFSVAGEAAGTLTILPLQDSAGNRFNTISTSPFTIYTSTSAESRKLDTRVHMQFGVSIPSVKPGTYRSNVIITLTE